LALLAAVEDELARALERAARLIASAADLGVGEELRHVCLPFSTAQQRGKDGCLWSEGRRQRRLDGEERA